jgi:outer membrane protein assembly factor BamB
VDIGTGRTLWTAEVGVGQLVALSGLVITHDVIAITALDAGTGRARWVAETGVPGDESTSGWGMVTDGRHVLTLDRPGDDWALVARDVQTGQTRWTAPPPVTGGRLSQLPDGTVLLAGPTEVVALRP